MATSASDFTVKTVQTLEQLAQVYSFATPILKLPSPGHALQVYIAHFDKTPQLLIFAERDGNICGCVLARIDEDHVLVGPVAVAEGLRRRGIGAAMMRELESQAKALRQDTILLGALEEDELFYVRCGYQPNLFIQLHEPDSVERLEALNEGYAVVWKDERNGKSKLMLQMATIDKRLQKKYDQAFPNCYTQYVFIKHI